MDQTTVAGIESSKRIAFNMVCSTAAHFLSAVIAFFLTPFLISRVGLEAYGFYPISGEVMALFGIFTGVVNAAAARYITVEDARGKAEEANRYFSTVFFANVAMCVLLLLPMGLFVAFADKIFSIPSHMVGELRVFFTLTLSSVIVNALSAAFGSSYSVTNRIDLRSAQDFIAVFLKATILFSLLGSGYASSIVSIGVAILISNAAAALMQCFMCRKLAPQLELRWSWFSMTCARRVMASGFWYSLDRLGAFLMTGGLLILSNAVFTSDGVGVYSISLTAARFLSGILLMLAGVFLPVTTKQFARGERARLGEEVVRDQKITGFFAAIGVAVGMGLCHDFFFLWLGEDHGPRLQLLTILSILPVVAIACAAPIVNLGMVMNRMRRLSLLFVGGGLLSVAVILAVSCFTSAGVTGVAAISCAAQLAWYGGAVPLFAARVLEVRPMTFYWPLIRCYFSCALSVGLIFVVKSLFLIESWVQFSVMGVLCAVFCAACGFVLVFGRSKLKI